MKCVFPAYANTPADVTEAEWRELVHDSAEYRGGWQAMPFDRNRTQSTLARNYLDRFLVRVDSQQCSVQGCHPDIDSRNTFHEGRLKRRGIETGLKRGRS